MAIGGLISLTQQYNQISELARHEARFLNKIDDWSVTHSREVLVQNAPKINKVYQQALSFDRQVHKRVSKIDFGRDYLKAKAIGPVAVELLKNAHDLMLKQLGMTNEKMRNVTMLLINEANSPEIPAEKRLNFVPSAPWFYQRWADNVGSAVSKVTTPIASAINFTANHPYAVVAGTAGLIAAGSLALCAPETAAKIVNSVMPDSSHETIRNAFTSASKMFESPGCAPGAASSLGCRNMTCIVGAIAGGVSLTSAALGASEPIGNAASTVGKGIKFAKDNPGAAIGNTAKAVVWDIPVGTLKVIGKTAKTGAQAIGTGLSTANSYAKNAHVIGTGAAILTAGAAHYMGADPVTTIMLSTGVFGSHLALKGLHGAVMPQPVVLEAFENV